ncbi:MAG: selenium metabolism-associated LysR family transcriptional regulator [Thermodesulfovibrionales bacterium]|nr:selenium metabolism-associated LysR family transcriptional regulator [Thermodesulfovibrionales bacterium]
MGLEDHKLKVFCTVAETKSFSKTSEIIHLTQPAVSLQVQALEETYESKLFDRTSNSITLTPSGEILYKYAKEILRLYAEAEKEIGKVTGLIRGCVMVGGSTTIGNYVLPNVIVAFKDKHPKIKVNLLIANTRRVEDLVSVGAIDFGLVEGIPSRQKITIEKLIEDELIVIVPPHHPWAKKKNISVAELTKEPFIIREEGSGTRHFVENFLKEQGIQLSDLKVVMSLGGIESIKLAVETGSGVSIISKWAARKEIKYGTLKGLYLKEAPMRRNFSLILPKNAIINHAVDEFLTFLKSYNYDELV